MQKLEYLDTFKKEVDMFWPALRYSDKEDYVKEDIEDIFTPIFEEIINVFNDDYEKSRSHDVYLNDQKQEEKIPRPKIIQDLIDEGQVNEKNGKYVLNDTIMKFLE